MRRSIVFFLVLLVALNTYLFLHHRLVALLDATIMVNAAACFWLVRNAFAPPEKAVKVLPGVQGIVVVLLLMLDAIVFMGSYRHLVMSRRPFIVLNSPAPQLHWLGFDSKAHALTEFSGKPVLLHFWGVWCMPCRVEFPQLEAYAARHPEITVIAIDANDEAGKGDKFVAHLHEKPTANLMFARDSDGGISGDIFRIPNFPTTILVDPSGQMRREYTRSVDWDGQEIDEAIRDLKPH